MITRFVFLQCADIKGFQLILVDVSLLPWKAAVPMLYDQSETLCISVGVAFLFVFPKANHSTSDYLAAFVAYNLLIFYYLTFVSYEL